MATMTTIEEAHALVLREIAVKASVQIPCSQAVGRIVAEDILTDLDSPPHRKSMVDGYAVIAADTTNGDSQLRVVEEVFAGQVPTQSISRGQATRIMTGAPLPDGADAVVMIEDTSIETRTDERSNRSAKHGVNDHCDLEEFVNVRTSVFPNQHVQEQGSIMRKGDAVLARGHRLRPIEVGLLSEVGRTEVSVAKRPVVSILPTGDELVDASEIPGPGQIRNTNGPMLESLVTASGAIANSLGIGRDDIPTLRSTIESGLANSDVLVLSGGVSMGRKDFVPAVLDDLNVQTVFHRVQLRPGKPIWFGVWKTEHRETLVFGLPGNPVSSFVCFQLFVQPALNALQGACSRLRHSVVHLADNFTLKGNRPTYFPARYIDEHDTIELLSWKGSADQRTMCEADCLAFFPHAGTYDAKSSIEALLLL